MTGYEEEDSAANRSRHGASYPLALCSGGGMGLSGMRGGERGERLLRELRSPPSGGGRLVLRRMRDAERGQRPGLQLVRRGQTAGGKAVGLPDLRGGKRRGQRILRGLRNNEGQLALRRVPDAEREGCGVLHPVRRGSGAGKGSGDGNADADSGTPEQRTNGGNPEQRADARGQSENRSRGKHAIARSGGNTPAAPVPG